jgi:hypothetical protein
MRIPTGKEREIVLDKLRQAAVFQIALWDAASEIKEALQCELSEVLDFVNDCAITADDGTELNYRDLDDLLGIADPGRLVSGKPLGYERHQVH